MTEDHPNIALLTRFDPRNMAAATDLFTEDTVFHYFNPNPPEWQGDHVGPDGIRARRILAWSAAPRTTRTSSRSSTP